MRPDASVWCQSRIYASRAYDSGIRRGWMGGENGGVEEGREEDVGDGERAFGVLFRIKIRFFERICI